MNWLFIAFFLRLAFTTLSEAAHNRNHHSSSAVVVGTVYCDTCFHQDFSENSHFISGATVRVECKNGNSVPDFRQEVKTNEHGEFKVELPFSVSKRVKKIKSCLVKIISSSEPFCSVASTATSSSLHLKSRTQGTHIFSAGFFTFKPQNQPDLCNQKPTTQFSGVGQEKDFSFPPPLQDPIPPPTLLPVPLPELPPVPGLPILLPPLPGKITETKSSKVVDNSESNQKEVKQDFFLPTPPIIPPIFQPPPSVLPPNPLQPPPLFPPLLPPNPLQPPPSPLLPFPPIPGLNPPPPPPALPIPFPPFPFPPTPLIPGRPPASTSP